MSRAAGGRAAPVRGALSIAATWCVVAGIAVALAADCTAADQAPAVIVVRADTSPADAAKPAALAEERWLTLAGAALLAPAWAERAVSPPSLLLDDDAVRVGLPELRTAARAAPSGAPPRLLAGRLLVVARVRGEGEAVSVELALSRGDVERHLDLGPGDIAARIDGLAADDAPRELVLFAEGVARLFERRFARLDLLIAALDAHRLAGEPARAAGEARALASRTGDAGAHRIVAQCLEARGQDVRAIASWREAVAAAPERAALHLGLARALERAKEPLEARRAFEAALERAAQGSIEEGFAREAIERIRGASEHETERLASWDAARARVDAARAAAVASETADDASSSDTADLPPDAPPERWLHRARELAARRLTLAALETLRRALEAHPSSRGLRLELARTLIVARRSAEVGPALAPLLESATEVEARVLLGDAAMATASADWSPDRWSDWRGADMPLAVETFLRVRRPDDEQRAASWRGAGALYAAALEAARARGRHSDDAADDAAGGVPGDAIVHASRDVVGDGCALARRADWLLLDGRASEAEALLREAPARPCADLERVRACVLHATGSTDEARAVLDRFLAHTVTRTPAIARVGRRLLERAADDAALEVLDELLARGLASAPEHPALCELRGELLRRRGDVAAAAAELRFVLAAGEPAWAALEALWAKPVLGPRSNRPPDRPGPFPRQGWLDGAPETFSDFFRLRVALAETLLGDAAARDAAPVDSRRAAEALAELRPLLGFLDKEEARLRGTRLAPPLAAERQWTAPDDHRSEPVDFENVRHRVQWATLRLLVARCEAVAGDHAAAARDFAWAARAVAVREGIVLPEARWAAELSAGERALATAAVRGLERLRRAQGREAEATALERLAAMGAGTLRVP